MNLFAVFFVIGATLVLQGTQLPSLTTLSLCVAGFISVLAAVAVTVDKWLPTADRMSSGELSPKAYLRQSVPLLAVAGLGLAGGAWLSVTSAQSELHHKLTESIQTRDVELTVRIIGLPNHSEHATQFRAEVLEGKTELFRAHRLQISWYHRLGDSRERFPQSGEIWRLNLRLKPPRGLSNPGGFDYAGWLFQQRVHAVGYVRSSPANRRLQRSSSALVGFRVRLDELLQKSGYQHAGVLRALVTGQRKGIEQSVWQLLRATGTSHLLAISGLHVGMVAACAYFFGHLLSRSLVFLGSNLNAIDMGGLLALIAATCYSLLAGFTLPTQRSLCMVAVLVLVRYRRRHLGRLTPLSIAAIVVLVLDPLAPLAPGFWLSFGAVAALFYVSRYVRRAQWPQRVAAALRMHVALGFLLLPATAWFFGQVSLIAPLANCIAVPVMSLLIVPLLLLWALVQCAYDVVQVDAGTGLSASVLLTLADFGVHGLLLFLRALSELPLAAPMTREVKPVVGLAAIAGLALCYLPRCPERYLVVPLMLPLLVSQWLPLRTSGLTLQVLDVGQGLAVLVSVDGRHLLYDTGGRLTFERSLAAAVIAPVLRHQGIRQLDRVMISHADLDHAAGVDYLRRHWAGGDWLLPPELVKTGESACVAGQQWRWGEAHFKVLSPPFTAGHDFPRSKGRTGRGSLASNNNRSCVLRIRYAGRDILLPGDIEKPVERQMARAWLHQQRQVQQGLREAPWRWRSVLHQRLERLQQPLSLLIAPHHGSKTSSTSAWLDSLRPERVIYSVGHQNRFGFPHETVQMRYKERGAREYRTDRDGALRFHVSVDGRIGEPERQRRIGRRLWHQPDSQPVQHSQTQPDPPRR